MNQLPQRSHDASDHLTLPRLGRKTAAHRRRTDDLIIYFRSPDVISSVSGACVDAPSMSRRGDVCGGRETRARAVAP